MNLLHKNVVCFFEEMLSDLDCQDDTRAYIIGIYGKYKTANFDLSKDSVGLMFLEARYKNDFATYQNIADWLLYTTTYTPSHLKFASKDYYDNVAQLSYYSCYRLINKQWKLYEQLSNDYVILTDKIHRIFIKNGIALTPLD